MPHFNVGQNTDNLRNPLLCFCVSYWVLSRSTPRRSLDSISFDALVLFMSSRTPPIPMSRRQLRPLDPPPTVTSDMKLAPNLGSDRAWVWNVSADYAESEPTAETFAIRFANSDSESTTTTTTTTMTTIAR